MVMGDLNAKVGQGNYMLNHVMGIHSICARNDNGESFVDFCSIITWWHNFPGPRIVRLAGFRLLEGFQSKSTTLTYLIALEEV